MINFDPGKFSREVLLKSPPQGPEQHRNKVCFVSGICLISKRCTYNFQQNSVLRQKLEFSLEEMVDFKAFSRTLYESEAVAIASNLDAKM